MIKRGVIKQPRKGQHIRLTKGGKATRSGIGIRGKERKNKKEDDKQISAESEREAVIET